MNILFVCTGNLNRSPAAQTIMEKLSPRDHVDSAATINKEHMLTTKKMRYALEKAGYNYTYIYSKPVTKKLITWADIVFYMQPSHRVDLNKFGKSAKYVNLAKYVKKTSIHDPHFEDAKAFDKAVKEIETAIKNYLKSRK